MRGKLMLVRVYRSRGQFRWQIKDHMNKKVIGASTEGYARQHHCRANFERITGFHAPVVKSGEKEASFCVWAGARLWNLYAAKYPSDAAAQQDANH